MRFRLVASDLDGTLLLSDGSVSARTKAVVEQTLQRVPFVIATGRPPRWVYPIAEELQLRATAVCSNGAITVDLATQEVLDARLLHHEAAIKAVEAIRSILPDVGIAVDRLSGLSMDPKYVPTFAIPTGTRVEPIEQLLDEPAIKLLFRHPRLDTTMLARIVSAVGSHALITYGAASGHATFDASTIDTEHPQSLRGALIEVMGPGVTKASALERLCDQQGIDAREVIAFGDMPNDVEMIEWAGHGVAMANGHRNVKAVANEIALSNDEHGVARLLERELKQTQ